MLVIQDSQRFFASTHSGVGIGVRPPLPVPVRLYGMGAPRLLLDFCQSLRTRVSIHLEVFGIAIAVVTGFLARTKR